MQHLFPFLLLSILPLAAAPPAPDSLQDAHQLYTRLFNARDAAALTALLHPDFSEFTASGDAPELWSTRSARERTAQLKSYFDSFETLQLEFPSTHFSINGDTGLVLATRKFTQKPKNGILEYLRARVTFTWVRSADRWLLLSVHTSAPPASAPAATPLPRDEAEARLLRTVFALPRWAGVPMADARLLRVLTESISARNVVELGTSTGFASLWIANALRTTGGRLTTFEIDPGRAATARRHFELAGVSHLVSLVEGDAHLKAASLKAPIDLLFIDADKDGYSDYLRQLLPLIRPGGLIVAHNMRFPSPSPDYVRAVTTDPALETVFLNMDDQGAAVTLRKR